MPLNQQFLNLDWFAVALFRLALYNVPTRQLLEVLS